MISMAILLIALLAPQRVRVAEAPATPNVELTPPEVAYYADPFYTRAARNNKVEGTVTVDALFDAEGRMTVLGVVRGLGYGLDESALAAIRSWKFCPARRDGAAVASTGQIDIEFNLRELPAAEFDDVAHLGPDTSPPRVLERVEPQYTAEARGARAGGSVILQSVVQTDGTVKILKIIKFLPLGLTESAMQAIEKWKFEPGLRDGKQVPVATNIEVNFNLEQTVLDDRFGRCSTR
jgi:protein TonB